MKRDVLWKWYNDDKWQTVLYFVFCRSFVKKGFTNYVKGRTFVQHGLDFREKESDREKKKEIGRDRKRRRQIEKERERERERKREWVRERERKRQKGREREREGKREIEKI